MKLFNEAIPGLSLFFVFLLLSVDITAQVQGKSSIKGTIIDSSSSQPLGYATIKLIANADRELKQEYISNDKGEFLAEAAPGTYYIEVSFMGFRPHITPTFLVNKPEINLGRILLAGEANTLEEVIVQAEKSSMQLSLDKKIFNVGLDLANAGGSAVDILSNVPSVSVDPEGTVKLRGSSNVRILIDGKPSGLVSFKGSGGLQQLQANMIERVEIITNPSARYEAEGMAGIINIVLRKEKKQGFNGSLELTAGDPANFGAAANLNYRHKKVNFFINYGIAYRRTPGIGSLYQEVYVADTTFILKQNTNGRVTGLNNNIRGGLDFYFNEKSILTAAYLFRRSDADRLTNIRYADFYFDESNPAALTTRRQDETEHEPNSEYSLVYKKSFAEKDHELIAEIKYLDNWESSDQLFTQKQLAMDGSERPIKTNLQNSLNDEWEKHFLLQVDYTKPIGKEGKFETGLRSSFRNMTNDYVVNDIDDSGALTPLEGLDNIFLYNENIHAVYGILGNKQNKISYQAGLRAEWTDVKTTLQETHQTNPRNYVNLFPSAHFTLDLPQENAIQLSYSRRVRRPFYNDLSPFFTFSDSRNFSSGNPDLDPEFSDVIEIGHIKYLDKGSLSSSIYYRYTNGKISHIRSVDDKGMSINKPENLLSEQAFGTEFIADYSVYKWWKLNFNVNFFHADIDGSNLVKTYKTSTYSWFARQTSRFTVAGNTDIQLRLNYEAPQKTVQGTRKSLYYADLSASRDVFKGKGTVNLNVLDIFNTRKSRSLTEGPNFFTRSDYQYRRRQLNATFSYRIKQAKAAKPKKEAGEE